MICSQVQQLSQYALSSILMINDTFNVAFGDTYKITEHICKNKSNKSSRHQTYLMEGNTPFTSAYYVLTRLQ